MCAPSNLTLDPDVYTCYLMDAALFRLPRLIDEIDRKRAVAMVVSSGSTSAVHQAELTRAGTIDELFFGDPAGSPTKSDGVMPGMLASLGIDRITKMQDALDSHVKALKDPAAIDASARELTAQLLALQTTALRRLDEGIEERFAGMASRLVIVATVLALGLAGAGYLFWCFYWSCAAA